MRLANDEMAISLGMETIRLRPTLRAAFRLEQRYEGFQNLSREISLCSASAITDVIREACINAGAVSLFLKHADENPFLELLLEIRGSLLRFVLMLAGVDDAPAQDATGEPIPFGEYFTKLYRIATGWLGWTPEQAWSATPAEIIEAHRGRTEMLAAIFGGKAKEDDTITDLASARDRLNALGNQSIHSMSEVPI